MMNAMAKMSAKGWMLAIGIGLMFTMFATQAISLAYPMPNYDDYCGQDAYKTYDTQQSCEAAGAQWNAEVAWCDSSMLSMQCQQDYEKASMGYNGKLLLIMTIVAVAVIAAGVLQIKEEPVALGALIGGLLTLLQGFVRAAGDGSTMEVIIMAAALAVLVWLGMKKPTAQV